MQLQVEESVIADVHIYTDALDTSIVERTTLLLAGIPYTAEAALDRSERTDDGPTKELLAYLASQI